MRLYGIIMRTHVRVNSFLGVISFNAPLMVHLIMYNGIDLLIMKLFDQTGEDYDIIYQNRTNSV